MFNRIKARRNPEEIRAHRIEKKELRVQISGNRKWIMISLAVIAVVGLIIFVLIKF